MGASRGTKTRSASDDDTHEEISSARLYFINTFYISYGAIFCVLGLFAFPAESIRMFPYYQNFALVLMIASAGSSQMLCPLIGALSDISEYELGRRRPFIIFGHLTAALFFIGMWLTSMNKYRFWFLEVLLLAQLSLALVCSAQQGLLPDLVSPKRLGEASGMVAVNLLLGAVLAFLLMFAFPQAPFQTWYLIFAAVQVIQTIITYFAAKEIPGIEPLPYDVKEERNVNEESVSTVDDSLQKEDLEEPHDENSNNYNRTIERRTVKKKNSGTKFSNDEESDEIEPLLEKSPTKKYLPFTKIPQLSLIEIKKCYSLDFTDPHCRDFNWVFCSRVVYHIAVSVQTFIPFFLRDVIDVLDHAKQKQAMAMICLTGQGTAAIVAYPLARLSDFIGRKPLIYFASVVLTLSYMLIGSIPWLAEIDNRLTMFYCFSALYGLGNGCFLSVDTALVIDVLPYQSQAARFMGLWGTSMFIGTTLGPLLSAAVIGAAANGKEIQVTNNGKTKTEVAYQPIGYLIMMAFASLCAIGASFSIYMVRHDHLTTMKSENDKKPAITIGKSSSSQEEQEQHKVI